MKRIKVTLVLGAVVATLVGCTGAGAAQVSPSPSVDADAVAVSTIKWEGGAENPKLVFDAPLRVSQATVGVIEPGDGDSLAIGQMVTFKSVVVDGETGAVESSSFGSATSDQLFLSTNTAETTMLTAMQSTKVGARFLYVVSEPQASTASPATPGATPVGRASKVIAISVRSVADLPAEAAGKAKTPDPKLPVVKFDGAKVPTLAKPEGRPGTKLATEVLIEGTGPRVGEGQTLVVKYYGWLWNGTAFDASWGDGKATAVNLNNAISGWTKAIAGKKVGSRVLMVVPPALGYGGAGQDAIPPDSTLVFLVDILAAS